MCVCVFVRVIAMYVDKFRFNYIPKKKNLRILSLFHVSQHTSKLYSMCEDFFVCTVF